MKDLQELSKHYGPLKLFTVPSGKKVVIREQNGEDDDIITNAKAVSKGESIANFVAAIVVDSEFTTSGKLSTSDAKMLRLADLYCIIIQSRIFSLGDIVNFQYQWDVSSKPIEYEEDLNQFIWDYEKPLPEEGSEDWSKYRLPKISPDLNREVTLTSGKKIIYDFANSLSEFYINSLPLEKQSKNAELLARNIRLRNQGGEYIKVENFRSFSKKDMLEINKDITENDPVLDLVSVIENPSNGEFIDYPVIASMDFFFPRGI